MWLFYILNSNRFPLSRRTAWNGLNWTGPFGGIECTPAVVQRKHLHIDCGIFWAVIAVIVLCQFDLLILALHKRATNYEHTYIEISWLPWCRPIWLFAALAVSLSFISIDQRAKKKRERTKKSPTNHSVVWGYQWVARCCCCCCSSSFFCCCWQLPSAIERTRDRQADR